MTFERPVVERRLALLRELLTEIEPWRATAREAFLENRQMQRAAERDLELAAEAVLEVAAHVLAAEFARFPETNEGLLDELARKGVISQSLRDELEGFGRLRNVLVHGYLEVTADRVHEHLQSVAVAIPRFIEEVGTWIDRRPG